MEQLPSGIEQRLIDLESSNSAVRQAAAVELGQMTTSNPRIVAALERAASAGGSPYDGSTQAATAAATALLTPAHRKVLAQMGHMPPVHSLYFPERRKPLSDPMERILPVLGAIFLVIMAIWPLTALLGDATSRNWLFEKLDLEDNSATAFFAFYYVGVAIAGGAILRSMLRLLLARRLLNRGSANAIANVVDRYKRRRALHLGHNPTGTIYYVKLEFDATHAEGTSKTIFLEARVKKNIYERFFPGATVQVHYALHDPCVVLLDGEGD